MLGLKLNHVSKRGHWQQALNSAIADPYIHGLVQERCNSIANPLELRLSCTDPLIYISPGLSELKNNFETNYVLFFHFYLDIAESAQFNYLEPAMVHAKLPYYIK